MKLTAKNIQEAKPNTLEAQVLQYLFVSEQAKKFEEQRKELADIIKAQVPVGEPLLVAGHKVSVSIYEERRFLPMAEAEKIVGEQIINQIAKAHQKSRLNVK